MLKRLLENKGHVCEEAENGLVAVERVQEMTANGDRFDALLMDFEMPIKDGGTATRELRSLGCDSFIVGVTGTLFSDDVENFRKCGADTVLPKPLHCVDLMNVLVENGVATAGRV